MQIALRKTSNASSNFFGRAANWATRARLVTVYCHGAVAINGDLYHVTTTGGLHTLKAGEWEPDKWDLFDVGTARDAQALEQFAKYQGAKYDWFSLLGFVGLRVHNDNRFYCFEWVLFAINPTDAVDRVTPEVIFDYVLKHVSEPIHITHAKV
jgi:hypothetical protein